MKLFAQIRKVDEAQRLVYGRAAQEVVDKADEVMDYESSKPNFQKWSEDIAKDTDGKSLGNVRAMHGKVAAGKVTGIDFIDAEKAIDIAVKVVDDNEWKKVLEGVYTGFSMGGRYAEGSKKVEKVEGKEVTRYTAIPSEISLVDRPCIPTAKFFEVQKADGTLAKVDFKEAAAEGDKPDAGATEHPVAKAEDADLEVQGTAEELAQLAKLMHDGKMSLGDVLKKLAPAAETPAAAAAPAAPVQKLEPAQLRKSMWMAAEFASVIASLQSLKTSAAYEAFYEGDDSGLAQRLAACIAMCAQVLVEMIQEEVAEGDGSETTIVVELAAKAKDLAKFEGDAYVELLKAGARNSKGDAARIAKIHDLAVELGHDCPAAKAAPAGDLAKAEPDALQKAIAAAIEPVQKALAEANDRVKKLEEQPAPAKVALRVVAKGEDVGSTAPVAPAEPEPVIDSGGNKHEAAGLIKSIHNSGGRPLVGQLRK